VKLRFSIIFTIIIFFSIGSCERRNLPDFTEVLERWGISMRHPKFEKLVRHGFLTTKSSRIPEYRAGGLKGKAKDHTINVLWHRNPVRPDEPENEYNRIKQILSWQVDNQRKRWIDPQTMPDDISSSPKDSNNGIKKWQIKETTGDFKWEERKYFMKDSCDYFTSPMNHRVFYQTWSYKDTADEAAYGITSVWICKQSNRMFTLTISNKYNNNVALLKKYLEDFKCHGIKP
jgi:hypothetical protein